MSELPVSSRHKMKSRQDSNHSATPPPPPKPETLNPATFISTILLQLLTLPVPAPPVPPPLNGAHRYPPGELVASSMNICRSQDSGPF